MNLLDQAKDKCSSITGITEALLYTTAGEFASKKDIHQVIEGRLPGKSRTFTRWKMDVYQGKKDFHLVK